MFSSLLFLLPRVLWKTPAQHWRGNSETAELCGAPWSRGIGRKSGSKGEGAGDRKTGAGACTSQTLLSTHIHRVGSFLLVFTYQTPLFWKVSQAKNAQGGEIALDSTYAVNS